MQIIQNSMEDNNTSELESRLDLQSETKVEYLSHAQKELYSKVGDLAKYSGYVLYFLTLVMTYGIYKTVSLMGSLNGNMGIATLVIMFIVLVFYFFIARSAHKFGSQLNNASKTDNPDDFYRSSSHLLAYFQLLGIPMMITVVLYGVMILFGLIFGASRFL